MAVSSQEASLKNPTDRFPLLMEGPENNENNGHIIDIERGGDTSSSNPSDNVSSHNFSQPNNEDRPSSSPRVPIIHSPSSSSVGSNRSSSLERRGEGRRHWSPFNTVLWISVELLFTLGQIIAAIVVLSVSKNENPQTPLFAWIVGYATGCTASLPLLYWRYINRNQGTEQASNQVRQGSSQGNNQPENNSYITISLTRSSEDEDGQNTSAGTWNGQTMGCPNSRLIVLVDNFKMALDCFFAVWFVVGNVWIFGGHSSSSDAPNLYRDGNGSDLAIPEPGLSKICNARTIPTLPAMGSILCIVFLTFSCIGYAMPFILCAMICCCLPCIISILGVRENMNQMRGASEESISALPTHKFKLKRNGSSTSSRDSSNSGADEGGFVAAGTEKERTISGEDALCCICLARYTDNDELRELPCSHFFHTECVDKWLKINASCPLCKFEIGGTNDNSSS
ncbi:hypothetical protein LguiA_019912 [Lonicera macranthoides]